MRTIQETHPWITFEADLTSILPKTWIILGECQAKCKHIRGAPLTPSVASYLQQINLARGVLATTAIEGNTLSEEEVIRHLKGELELSPSREYLRQEIDNILAACNSIQDEIVKGETPELSVGRIKELNRIILNKLPVDSGVVPGEIRTHNVGVAMYKAPPPEQCEALLESLCVWLNSDGFRPPAPEVAIASAIVKAIVAHLYLAWIHPFGDGNGRTARLVELQILFASGVPAPATHLLSNHYNNTRSEYYRQLDRASRSGGDITAFMSYAIQGLTDGLKEQLELILLQQLEVAWLNFVHETLDGQNAPTVRRRRLLLDLSQKNDPVPLGELSEMTPRVAKQYAGKTIKTILRDVNHLRKMGLISRTPNGYRAMKGIILAFLPVASGAAEE